MPLFQQTPGLLEAFREGRREALEIVYRHYARTVDDYFRALARWAGKPQFAQPTVVQDMLQETFMRAFADGARRAYDPRHQYSPYLRSIARNHFIDQLRRQKHETPFETAEPALTLEAPRGDDGYDPRVILALEDYLRELPLSLRDVYEQRFILGLTQAAACERLGLTRRSLRTQEHKLRQGLRKALLLAGLLEGGLDFGFGALTENR